MKRNRLLSLLCIAVLLVGSLPAHAQSSEESCEADPFQMASSSGDASADAPAPSPNRAAVTDPRPAISVSPETDAEAFVQDRIQKDGLHVVHFWAPWCPNSTSELDNGWAGLVEDNPGVSFTFVTVWNDGTHGASVLDEYDLPERVVERTQPDLGPSDDESNRRYSFLGLPVTWIPSTWIFHENGELAFALNYGEMEMTTIQSLLDATRKDW